MRVAIVGSRTFAKPRMVRDYVLDLIDRARENGDELTIVTGGAAGPDTYAEATADDHQIPVALYLPAWGLHGKRAGFLRNEEIVGTADCVVAFWDGESRGTKHTIDLALKHHKNLEVIFDGGR